MEPECNKCNINVKGTPMGNHYSSLNYFSKEIIYQGFLCFLWVTACLVCRLTIKQILGRLKGFAFVLHPLQV